MKKGLIHTLIVLLCINANLYSQKASRESYTVLVEKEVGDLNKDKVDDKVILEMDTLQKQVPFRLQIFLSLPNEKVQLAVSSTKIIESQYPKNKGGKHNGNPVPNFYIEEGNLVMLTDIDNRKSRYEFRFKQNNFELTKISRAKWDGKETTHEVEIDLLKGTKKEYDRDYSPIEKNIKKTKLNSIYLPKLQDLSFSDLEKF